MPFDNKVWHKTAIQGDVAGIAICASVAISNLRLAIEKIKLNEDASSEMEAAGQAADDLHKIFRDLTGYFANGE